MSKRALLNLSALAMFAFTMSFGAPKAEAIMIDVLAESTPGSGTFDILIGTIESFDNSGESAADSYNYDDGLSLSYGGDDITPTGGVSQIFFVENSNGLNFFWVHGGPGGSIGSANTTVTLMDPGNSSSSLDYLVLDDDPLNVGTDSYTQVGDDFNSIQNWGAGLTDGFVLGPLNSTVGSGWMLLTNFNTAPGGITTFVAAGGLNGPLNLNSYATEGNQIKFALSETEPSEIPEPGTIALFGLGLVGLFGLRRKRS